MIYLKANSKLEVGQAINLAITATDFGHSVTLFVDKKRFNPAFKGLVTIKPLGKHEGEELTDVNCICVSEQLDKGVFAYQGANIPLKEIKAGYSFLSLGSHKYYRDMATRILSNSVHKSKVPYFYPV